jgi:oxygen-dependent protoporphyrinogen oxidase
MIAIVGGGLSGLATAYQLACEGIEFNLFEASGRLGGIVETVHRQGFVIECGPDSWVTEKPWARELAVELGLEARIISSNDQWRRTYVQQGAERNTQLIPIPDGMRMMVPARWGPLLESPLFSWQARLAYLREPKRAEELKASAPAHDESVADFVRRHFGDEVATTIAGPLLAAIFGGDIAQLSVRAVMPTFVRMEAEQGSLVQAVQRSAQQSSSAIFTTLVDGLETLIDRMVARLPPASLRLRHPVLRIERDGSAWRLTTIDAPNRLETGFDAVVLATPPNVTRDLLQPLSPPMAGLLPQQASSAIVVAFAFAAEQASRLRIPRGFGFVVLACPGGVHRKNIRYWPALLSIRSFPVAFHPGQRYYALSSAEIPPMHFSARQMKSSSSEPACNWAASLALCRKPRKPWFGVGRSLCRNTRSVTWIVW